MSHTRSQQKSPCKISLPCVNLLHSVCVGIKPNQMVMIYYCPLGKRKHHICLPLAQKLSQTVVLSPAKQKVARSGHAQKGAELAGARWLYDLAGDVQTSPGSWSTKCHNLSCACVMGGPWPACACRAGRMVSGLRGIMPGGGRGVCVWGGGGGGENPNTFRVKAR